MEELNDVIKRDSFASNNRVSVEFERAFREGGQPKIEDFLRQGPESPTPLFEELLKREVELRRALDETPNGNDYYERFPQFREEIVECFRALHATSPPSNDRSDAQVDLDSPYDASGENTASMTPQSDAKLDATVPMPTAQRSQTIGSYKLLQRLGEGGMGTVWMAEQSVPVRRRVALKLIKDGIDNKQIIARFEAERQALAMMDHHNIAKVLDAGTTESGQPYFVMELVQGISFTKYCDENKLSIKDRLELFIPVCNAVQHAHQKGIIHRDLKPSNVLVCMYDGKPVPKVIDFGLAKALQHQNKLTDKTMFTEFGQVVGTLQYMSPEQAEMNQLDIDTRTDVYSLGVMLYELLTGSTPIQRETLQKEAIYQILATIREQEPPRPSVRLSSLTQQAATGISAQRCIDTNKLKSVLRGDLDWIVMRTLEKDRCRRYDTANGLARDIERFLNDEAVEACPPSNLYRMKKFVRKHRGQVTAASFLFIAMGLGILGTTWGYYWAKTAGEKAKLAQQQTQTALDALTKSTIDAVQNNLGASVPSNLEKLDSIPRESLLADLELRLEATTNPLHKLALAFALAHVGHLDSDYLVSRIDDIADGDKQNFLSALLCNKIRAMQSVRAAAASCGEKSLWRRKAKLAVVALNLGDAALAADVCEIEDRPDPEQRTLFVDEFPRWENRLYEIHDLVANDNGPALRSAVCLGVGQIAVEKLNDTDKDVWQSLASRWFVEKGDTTTHSAAGWLLRRWGISEPKAPDCDKIFSQRDWFVNSVGATMLKIRCYSPGAVELTDPLETFRKQLAAMSRLTASELDEPITRQTRAIAHYQVGNIESALEDLDWLLLHGETATVPQSTLGELLQYRTMALARLGKADEAKESLAKHHKIMQLSPFSWTYMQIQLPAWLGDYSEATRRLELELVVDSSSSLEYRRYKVACAASLCSKAAITKSPEQSKQFADRAFEILGELIREGYSIKQKLLKDPDFANVHKDDRFASLIKEAEKIPEFWVADREVSRGQFELFMRDASYPAKEKPEKWMVDTRISPTADHPAQRVFWYDSLLFCNWLSLHEGRNPCYERTGNKENGLWKQDAWRLIPGSNGYRLLSDAEWDYACRAGTQTKYSMGNDEVLLVNYCQMYPSKLSAVCGEKIPNGWGLHDVHGNVLELCAKSTDSIYRVGRGGSWSDPSENCRSAGRREVLANERLDFLGFRVALVP